MKIANPAVILADVFVENNTHIVEFDLQLLVDCSILSLCSANS
ncbi:MAG TPA: hypothetical protein PLN17_00990 [Candidatus Cloacimonas sp.]|nr:hypothetical protein [Candidatus Cloacimonadota bacterium]HOQ77437.1 hypothetical protein [Candidatus Cloacimonas sp.]HPV63853.1 hypothetical protein [Candidatus Cloacimonas sp.]HQJ95665.1 hypothetical protein [Candidatus Cloacimonas sp.]